MSMLGYYNFKYPKDFFLFPVVPEHPYVMNKHICNLTSFGPGGTEVGPATGTGVWDPNSWGQLIGTYIYMYVYVIYNVFSIVYIFIYMYSYYIHIYVYTVVLLRK